MNEDIKQKILSKYPTGMDNALYLSQGACFGYSLAEQEIERLKGLIESAHEAGRLYSMSDLHGRNIDQFKIENNL